MKEYAPRRRTALVFAGTGTSGAYHAGVLKALDECGIKIDLVVGSGVGVLTAAFGAVAGGAKLYGADGLWQDLGWDSLYRLKPAVRVAVLLLSISLGVFVMPLLLALVAGLLVPLALILDLVLPGLPSRWLAAYAGAPAALRTAYLAALAVPVFALCAFALIYLTLALLRDRRRVGERFESWLDVRPARNRVARALWQVTRGSAVSDAPPTSAELGQRYVAMATENQGQPGFRELVLETTDLDRGGVLPFILLQEPYRAAFASRRSTSGRSHDEAMDHAVDLTASGYDALFFHALMSALLPPLVAPVQRVSFPRRGLHAGETHRLSDGTLSRSTGLSDALAAGAEQVIFVSAVCASPQPARRRGWHAMANDVLATLERQSIETDIEAAERMNRMVETLGHVEGAGSANETRAWQDPATGRLYREFSLYLIRPERRRVGPLDFDGAQDPGTEVLETTEDLLEQGYRDAYRQFVEPVVGAIPEPRRTEIIDERQPVEL